MSKRSWRAAKRPNVPREIEREMATGLKPLPSTPQRRKLSTDEQIQIDRFISERGVRRLPE